MDRRAALKKLAAGGAIAAGGSMVLSSNNVAFAVSNLPTGIPTAGQPLPITYSATNGQVNIGVNVTAVCGAGTATTQYSWGIDQYNVSPGFLGIPQVRIRNAANTATIVSGPVDSTSCGPGCTGALAGPSSNGAIAFTKRQYGTLFGFPIDFPTAFSNGDSYKLLVLVTWQCTGGTPVTAEYRISGTYPAAPTAVNLSYSP